MALASLNLTSCFVPIFPSLFKQRHVLNSECTLWNGFSQLLWPRCWNVLIFQVQTACLILLGRSGISFKKAQTLKLLWGEMVEPKLKPEMLIKGRKKGCQITQTKSK